LGSVPLNGYSSPQLPAHQNSSSSGLPALAAAASARQAAVATGLASQATSGLVKNAS